MGPAWGIIVLVVSLIGWLGQVISWLAPATAVRLTLMEAEADVEPVYWADARGEAMWDSVTLWTLPLAGALLVLAEPGWAIFGLIGGGMGVYTAGRVILTRLLMQRRGFRVGSPQSMRIGNVFMTGWGVVALITIIAAAAALQVF